MQKRFKHRLNNYKLTTGDMGQLIPIGCVDAVPGDTFQHATSLLLRVSPLVAPVMHPVEVRVHHWFVPFRLLWSSWEDFITGGADGNDASVIPTVAHTATPANEPLLTALGVPKVASLSGINALYVRAYNYVFNHRYRDKDLVTEVSEDSLTLQNISWEKDYFMGARPWTQKGDAVSVPISGEAPVLGLGLSGTNYPNTNSSTYVSDGSVDSFADYQAINNSTADSTLHIEEDPDNAGYPNVRADLTQADAIDIQAFRMGFALQRYKEARAKYGHTYSDYLRYLGINPKDSRLQEPEYLGGGKQTISFSEVLQTAPESASSSVVGELKGHGIAALRTNRYRRFIPEHGVVISLMSVRPKAIYTNGLHKKFFRSEKEDYFTKELELIGASEILNKEVYANNDANDDLVFGYAPARYTEYHSEPSTVSGEFLDALDHFHLARKFSSLPTLNAAAIKCEPSKRIHADTSSNTLWVMANHNIVARRPMSRNPVARII